MIGAVLAGIGRGLAAGARAAGGGRLLAFRTGMAVENDSKNQEQEKPQQQMPKGYV